MNLTSSLCSMNRNMSGKNEKCEMCTENASKYKCPKCLLRTCSLECVNSHKTSKSCDGKREKTSYVSVKDFTDLNLLNDYRFLEDTCRKSDSAERDICNKRRNLNYQTLQLVKLCTRRGIKMRAMPYPMSKRKNNASYLNKRTKVINWQVEWIFPHCDATYINNMSENETLLAALETYIHPEKSDPVKRQKLKQYVLRNDSDLKLFMKIEGSPSNDPRYNELDLMKTLNENLHGKEVIEYPTIHVLLRDRCSEYRLPGQDPEAESSSATSDSSTDTSSSSESGSDSEDDSDSGNHLSEAPKPDESLKTLDTGSESIEMDAGTTPGCSESHLSPRKSRTPTGELEEGEVNV